MEKLFECDCCGEKFPLEELKVTDDDRLLCEQCWEETIYW